MKLFIERKSVVQAVRFTGDNIRECVDAIHPGWQSGELPPGWWTMIRPGETRLVVETSGYGPTVTVSPGEWLVKNTRDQLQVIGGDEFEERFIAARDIGVQP